MSSKSPSRLRSILKSLRTTRVRAVLSLGIVLGFGAVSTLAYWTDQATLTGGAFTAGTLDIKLGGVDNNPAAFSTSFAMTNMQPGSQKSAAVSVQNTGSLDFTYTATGVTTGNASTIGPLLVFQVVPGGTVSGSTCTGGTQTYNATMSTTASSVVPVNRPIAAAASESFCVAVTLPTGTTTGQGSSTTATFTLNAKQIGAP